LKSAKKEPAIVGYTYIIPVLGRLRQEDGLLTFLFMSTFGLTK
jgi:hypothetical protein